MISPLKLRTMHILHGLPPALIDVKPRKKYLHECKTYLLSQRNGAKRERQWRRSLGLPRPTRPTKPKPKPHGLLGRKWSKGSRSTPTKKIVITPARRALRDMHWQPLRFQLRQYLYPSLSEPNKLAKGRSRQIATLLGVAQSQVHRWSCPKCKHDVEPSFSTGVALASLLASLSQQAQAQAQMQMQVAPLQVG